MALHEKELVTVSQRVIAVTELQLYSPTGILQFGSKAALLSLGAPTTFCACYIHTLFMGCLK